MTLLEGKRILVTGIITDASIAFHAAKAAQEAGATVVLTGFGRLSLVKRVAKRLPHRGARHRAGRPEPGAPRRPRRQRPRARRRPRRRPALDRLRADGGPGRQLPATPSGRTSPPRSRSRPTRSSRSRWPAGRCSGRGSSLVGMDFDNTVAWPGYDWMGVAKAALEATTRYLARDLGPEGIRANLVAAGPVRTMAAKSIPGFDTFEEAWVQRSPLGWDLEDPDARREDDLRAALGLDAGHHRRGRPRRRRLPRDGRLRPNSSSGTRVGVTTATARGQLGSAQKSLWRRSGRSARRWSPGSSGTGGSSRRQSPPNARAPRSSGPPGPMRPTRPGSGSRCCQLRAGPASGSVSR